MIARLAWAGALLVLATLTAFLQLDRQSDATPSLAPLVPEPFRGYAQAQLAAMAAEGPDAELALAEAQRLVRRRPVPAEHLTLLAVAQAKANRTDEAGVTIQIAAQRGWREPVAQEAVLRLALDAGDKPEAARRYAALFLHPTTSNDLLRELAPTVLGEPGGEGQRTLVDILSGTDRWNSAFLRRGAQVIPASAFADIATASMKRGLRFDCGVLALAIKDTAQRDQAAADRLKSGASGSCPDLQ